MESIEQISNSKHSSDSAHAGSSTKILKSKNKPQMEVQKKEKALVKNHIYPDLVNNGS